MESVRLKAQKQAIRHAEKFISENEWQDLLEKYAEVNSEQYNEIKRIGEREERGARIEEQDYADFFIMICIPSYLAVR